MPTDSHHQGAANEFETQYALLHINDLRPKHAPPIVVHTTDRFDHKHIRCKDSYEHHFTLTQQTQAFEKSLQSIVHLRKQEPMFDGLFTFGGHLNLDAPSDQDCALTNDVRDLIATVQPLACYYGTDVIANTLQHQAPIGLSFKRNSNERRAVRGASQLDDQGNELVFIGNILGLQDASAWQDSARSLAQYIAPTIGVEAKSEHTNYKHFLLTHALHGAHQMVKSIQSPQQVADFLTKQLGSHDYYTFCLHDKSKTHYLQCVQNNRLGTLGGYLDPKGKLCFPSAAKALPTKIVDIKLIPPKAPALTTNGISDPERLAYMLQENYTQWCSTLLIYLDNDYILALRLHNGNDILGYSMIKCSTRFENELDHCATSRIYTQKPARTPKTAYEIISDVQQALAGTYYNTLA